MNLRPLLSFLVMLGVLPGSVFAAESALRASIKNLKGEPLADTVVSLVPLDAPLPTATAAAVEIAQEDKQYDPYVTPIQVGTRVDFPNKDNIQHHLYSLSKPKRFEKPLYAGGARETVVFDQPGVVTLGCNIHDWMVAYVVILNTPWFAKTGPDGQATITHVPPGRYRIEVWHPRLAASITRDVTLTETAAPAEEFSLALKPERRIRRAPENKVGGY